MVVLQAWYIFTRTRTIAMFYLKFKIVHTCESFHYLMTINLETVQWISFTKVTCTDMSHVHRHERTKLIERQHNSSNKGKQPLIKCNKKQCACLGSFHIGVSMLFRQATRKSSNL